MRIRMLLLLGAVALVASACATGGGQLPEETAKKYSREEASPLTRAEAADLLVAGLALPERLACDPSEPDRPEFKLPSAPTGPCPPPLPRDAVGSPQVGAVVFVVCIRLRGLEVRPDGRFDPDRPIRRAEWVLALADLTERLGVGAPAAGTAPASFPDVPADHYARDAALRMSALGLVQPRDDGRFEPTFFVTRGEALESTRRLQELLGPG